MHMNEPLARGGAGSLPALEQPDAFLARHIGTSDADQRAMLDALGFPSRAALMDAIVPALIRRPTPLELPDPVGETEALARLGALAAKNRVLKSFLGQGYYGTATPGVILRNVLENPAWYTAYTPYQPEISQGRLEALVNFQTMVCDLTGMAIANASMLDEATAAAEAMTLCRRMSRGDSARFYVADDVFPQTLDVVRTRARPLGIEVVVGPAAGAADAGAFAVLLQYPGDRGEVRDYGTLTGTIHAAGGYVIVAADVLALTLLSPPGEWGADVVVGSTQRFGVPMGYGGPHAAYLATRDEFKRSMPGRLVGVTVDVARQSRVPARAADPRAAHPAREGDVQHLHRAGAAGGDRRHVRGLARARGPGCDRPPRPPDGRGAAAGLARLGFRRAVDAVLRHLHRRMPARRPTRSSPGPWRAAPTSAASTPRRSRCRSTRRRPATTSLLALSAFADGVPAFTVAELDAGDARCAAARRSRARRRT